MAKRLRALALAMLATALMGGCGDDPGKVEVKPGGYVGSEVCGQCHDRIASTWKTTPHSMVIRRVSGPDDPAILGDWATPPDFKTVDAAGQTVAVTDLGDLDKKNILLVHGVLWKQRYVDMDYEVQKFQWNMVDNAWAPYHFSDPVGPDWRTDCAYCHVTGFRPEDNGWSELSIGCEACHGPGAAHVQARGLARADTIINPAKLPWHLASDICGQCHTRGKSPDGKHPHPVGFRVGKRLLPGMFQVTPSDNTSAWWPSGAIKQHRQQYPEWQTSKHFKAGISCLDCHTTHSTGNRFSTKVAGNNLCLGCHTTVSTDPVNGHAPIKDAPQHGDCIACHMPATGKSATVGDERTHTFRFIPPRLTLELGGGELKNQPNSCNSCHYHGGHAPAELQARLDAARRPLTPTP
jgi:predicted CXXCH cytochrome family protein